MFARGMRKMEAALPPATLRAKLPRFLQKCAQEFQDDARYRDDPRYLRVWIQLVSHLLLHPPIRHMLPFLFTDVVIYSGFHFIGDLLR